jgi:iron(III) transport system substrate-binding protein
MKKLLALVMALVFAMSLSAMAMAAVGDFDADLVAAAKEDGELIVYGSCEEAYLSAACQKFEEEFGIKTSYQRLSTGEVQAKITEENGNPSADVWFGGTNDPYAEMASTGMLEAYEAKKCGSPDLQELPGSGWILVWHL